MRDKKIQEVHELLENPELPSFDAVPLFWELDSEGFYIPSPDATDLSMEYKPLYRLTEEQFQKLNEKFPCFLP